jgi:hypothetical protein
VLKIPFSQYSLTIFALPLVKLPFRESFVNLMIFKALFLVSLFLVSVSTDLL